jgi:malate dehydrogenase (NADP+)
VKVPRAPRRQQVCTVRADAAAAAAAAAVAHSPAEKYGVFRLSYDVSNVRVIPSRNDRTGRQPPHALCLQEDPILTKTWKKTIKVAVTGAAGNISNHLLFMVSMCFSVWCPLSSAQT